MADDGTAAVASQRPIVATTAILWPGRRTTIVLAVASAAILLALASQTVFARYVYYRAEDAAWAVRKEIRTTVDAIHNWWHHVKKTVAQRDKKRTANAPAATATDRWVGTVNVPKN